MEAKLGSKASLERIFQGRNFVLDRKKKEV
jgi:hypothetical protein